MDHRREEEAAIELETQTTTHTRDSPYTIQHLLSSKEKQRPNPCVTGCCDCPSTSVYLAPMPFYPPYLYSFYRQQAAWRQSVKENQTKFCFGVASMNPQNTLYSQVKQRKPRRPWTRAVFSNLQRKGLEKRFQVQKYLTKGDRHQLASMLGLSDNQVKVWFQNRRMKWRQEERTENEPVKDKAESHSWSQSWSQSSSDVTTKCSIELVQ